MSEESNRNSCFNFVVAAAATKVSLINEILTNVKSMKSTDCCLIQIQVKCVKAVWQKHLTNQRYFFEICEYICLLHTSRRLCTEYCQAIRAKCILVMSMYTYLQFSIKIPKKMYGNLHLHPHVFMYVSM